MRYVIAEIDKRTQRKIRGYCLDLNDRFWQSEIIDCLVEKSQGMYVTTFWPLLACNNLARLCCCRFLWVKLQLDCPSRISGDNAKRQALKTLPPDLPKTYRRMLDHIVDDSSKNSSVRLSVG